MAPPPEPTSGGPAPRHFRHDGTDRFVVVEPLWTGRSSTVYRAFDTLRQREVALKTLAPGAGREAAGPDGEYFLRREFRSRAGIEHPNLVTFYELVVEPPQSFFTMELVRGETFLAHVRPARAPAAEPGAELPWRRFARAALQLALGVDALHVGRTVHRDLKPDNVKVTPEGRVVVLDFGSATALQASNGLHHEWDRVAGTPEYWPPEALFGEPATPASDWFSAGVMFFEALTGRLPFVRRNEVTFDLENTRSGPSPRDIDPRVPAELAALVAGMLAYDPAARPDAAEIFRVLRGFVEASDHPGPVRLRPPFVGREREMQVLTRTVERQQARGARCALVVRGPSGIGKTELVTRFADALDASPGSACFRGRCHDRESVPYKSLNGVVDGVARFLLNLPDDESRSLVPEHAAALVRQFPTLAPALRVGSDRHEAPAEPQEALLRATRALCDLLDAIARRWKLVVWIDDLQWGDSDSVPLLRELLARPTPATFVFGWCSEDEGAEPALDAFRDVLQTLPEADRAEVTLPPLARADAAEIARALLDDDAPRHLVDAVADECDGSPFLAQAIATLLGAGRAADDPAAPPRLAEAFARRLDELSPAARELLEVVAIAGAPVALDGALAACARADEARRELDALPPGLVRVTRRDGAWSVVTYHDRVRAIVLALLSPAQRAARSGQLAHALAARPECDPLALVDLFVVAGDARRAGRFAVLAAARASASLAFELAARLYRVALAQRALAAHPEGPTEQQLEALLAEVLVNAGRGAEAAHHFLRAAGASARQGGGRFEALRFERLAVEQHLRSGVIEEGVAGAGRVLAFFGERLPESDAAAMREALLARGRFLLRGTRRPAGPARPDPEALPWLDACWSVCTSLGFVRPMHTDALAMRHLHRALALGDPSRLCRAFALEASFEASIGGALFRARAARLIDVAFDLARETGTPYDHAWSLSSAGLIAFVGTRWREALALHDRSLASLRQDCRGVAWEVVMAEAFAVTSAAYLGDLAAVSKRLPRAISDAEARGDRFGAMHLKLGQPGVAWLAADRPEHALTMVDEAVARWPAGTFLTQHYLHLLAAVQALLYRGAADEAWARVEAAWPRVRAAHWERLEFARGELNHVRGRAALASAARRGGSQRERLLAVAERSAGEVDATHLPWSEALAASLRAGVAACRGDRPAAAAHLMLAARGFRSVEMALHAECAELARGAMAGDVGAAARAEAATTWLRGAGVLRPTRMAAMFFPGAALSEG